ncbi:MAG: DUF1566 domain-containing protein [Comamonadaceae bacterium]|nr:DUF1566 domain-containing protein [Comamonadaceae bacterium]
MKLHPMVCGLVFLTLAPTASFQTSSQTLDDTGIDVCRDRVTGVDTQVTQTTDCTPQSHGRQDARVGRDAAAAKGALVKAGGGSKGFDFIKIGIDGKPVAVNAKLGSASGEWACSYDNNTGLMWEVKTKSGLRSLVHTYAWYDSVNNYNNSAGSLGTGTCEVGGRCNTQSYVEDINGIKLCGRNDWRMPTINELSYLTDRGRISPAIDPDYFPNTESEIYWSTTPHVLWAGYAWAVGFELGSVVFWSANSPLRVRLVRTGK